MNIIITGVAGFIGSNLLKKLLEDGHRVSGIDNFSYGSPVNIDEFKNNPQFIFFERDLRNPNAFEGIKGEILVHLASQKIPRYTNALRTLNDNYQMLHHAVNKCLQDKIKLIYASTSDVYGKNPDSIYSETSDLVLGPTKVKRWAYAISKIYGEQYIIANHDEHQLKYTITRFFGSYGPKQNLSWWGGPQSVFINNSIQNIPLEIHGDGLQTRVFTFIDDLIDGLSKCLFEKKSENEIFNIAGRPDEEITILDLANLIWRLINNNTAVPLNYISYDSFGNYEDVKRKVPDISKLKKMLGYEPNYSLEEGLIRTIEWQKKYMNQ